MAQINNQTPKVGWTCDPRRGRGLRLVQFWVPDTKAPSFIDGLRSQCLALPGDFLFTNPPSPPSPHRAPLPRGPLARP